MNATPPTAPATPSAAELRERFESTVLGFLSVQHGPYATVPREADPLVVEIERLVRSGGKRLRPLFGYWGYRAAGGEDGDEIVRAASALELLHTYAIVHDDVMDRSRLRRGEPATYRRLAASAPEGLAGAEAEHFGLSSAILVGDLALVFADRLLAASGFPPTRLQSAMQIYHRMRSEVIAGQYMDMVAAARRRSLPEETRRIAFLKSGGYTVEKPLLMGAALAGAPNELLEALSAFGAPLGEAFQLRDDLLGAFGQPGVTGKDADSDFREGKQTLIVTVARDKAKAGDATFLEERIGRADLTPVESERIRELLRSTGASAEVERTIDELLGRARGALEAAGIPDEPRLALHRLAEHATARIR